MAFSIQSETIGNVVKLSLSGELDAGTAGEFRSAVESAAAENPERVVLILDELTFMASAGLRVLVFAKQKMGSGVDLYIAGAHDAVKETITMTGFDQSVLMVDSYED
jgi:anti-anti-sigma factor